MILTWGPGFKVSIREGDMAKSYPFNVLSDEKFCAKCGRPLKKRIAEEKPNFHLCYNCFKKTRG